ncbi:uncharacterized protein LACBIDRAFT_333874 [Laccaria bicolor S238N-H82]|uniref:Predicted protein n=1 Tax=Laccaria bicolor (strain S238N-H82 / ATCC MYA-4686) TaxID=486041 RepID=B0DXC9_LACBS|nr:uncharacterized protein LACBIDRAFT_333874 [Laccaria bicolor S238N-H82]EDR00814.1 predicted protein [Laccaria bicolor S238N-H82]|eukprot:XP_001888606.1 predicted protein [Laccaria bicolor S238N-H82]
MSSLTPQYLDGLIFKWRQFIPPNVPQNRDSLAAFAYSLEYPGMVLQLGPEGYITPEVRLDNFAEAHRLAAGNHPNRAPNAYSVAYSKTHTSAIQHAYGTSALHGRTHPPLTSEEDQELKNYRNQQAFTYFNMPVPASLMDYPITQCAEYMSLPPVLQAATEVVGSVQVTMVMIHRKNEKDMPMCLNCQAYA